MPASALWPEVNLLRKLSRCHQGVDLRFPERYALHDLLEAKKRGIGPPCVWPGRCCAKFAHAGKTSEPGEAEHDDCPTEFAINRRI